MLKKYSFFVIILLISLIPVYHISADDGGYPYNLKISGKLLCWDWSHVGNTLACISISETGSYYVSFISGTMNEKQPTDEKGFILPLAEIDKNFDILDIEWSYDDKNLVILTREKTEVQIPGEGFEVYMLDLDSLTLSTYLKGIDSWKEAFKALDFYYASAIEFDSATGILVVESNTPGLSEILFYDTAKEEVLFKLRSEEGETELIGWQNGRLYLRSEKPLSILFSGNSEIPEDYETQEFWQFEDDAMVFALSPIQSTGIKAIVKEDFFIPDVTNTSSDGLWYLKITDMNLKVTSLILW